jgi:NAD(P)-dependent dehydrogenase (short-subunit alcohol dehydrogenase family)
VLPADVADESAVIGVFSRIRDEWGSLSVLVNNAGWARFSTLATTSL